MLPSLGVCNISTPSYLGYTFRLVQMQLCSVDHFYVHLELLKCVSVHNAENRRRKYFPSEIARFHGGVCLGCFIPKGEISPKRR
jgi:hypothetical protein